MIPPDLLDLGICLFIFNNFSSYLYHKMTELKQENLYTYFYLYLYLYFYFYLYCCYFAYVVFLDIITFFPYELIDFFYLIYFVFLWFAWLNSFAFKTTNHGWLTWFNSWFVIYVVWLIFFFFNLRFVLWHIFNETLSFLIVFL